MGFYLGTLVFLLVVFGYIQFFCNKFNWEFGKSLFLSISFITFLMSIFSMIDIMLFGYYFISVLGFVFFVFFFIKNIIRKRINFKNIFTPSSLIFLLLLIYFFFAAKKINILMGWDEASYWATTVKRLFYFNSYVDFNHFIPMYYPPVLTSFNYFVVKFIGMQDSAIYFAQYFYLLSGIVFLIRNMKWKNIIVCLFGLLSIFLFLILLFRPFILTLYSELPLIITLGISIVLFVTAKNKTDYLFATMLLWNVTLIKSNGLAACVLTMIIGTCFLFSKIFAKLKKDNIKIRFSVDFFKTCGKTILNDWPILLFIFIPIIAQIIFNMFLSIHNISNFQSPNSGILSFLKALFADDLYSNNIVINYFNALSSNYANYTELNISSVFIVVALTLCFVILLKIYFKKDNNLNNNRFLPFAAILGFVLYALILLYSYCFMFSKFEASVLASFDRYINTYIGALGIGIIGILIYYSKNNDNNISKKMKTYILILFISLLSIVNISEIYIFVKTSLPFTEQKTEPQLIEAQQIANKYKNTFDENDKIHIIVQGDYGLTVWGLIYYLTPNRLYDPRFEKNTWSIRPYEEPSIENTQVMSPEKYIKYLKKYKFTHVLIAKIDDNFKENYKDCFYNMNVDDIKEGIYRFDDQLQKLVLIK